MKIELRRLNDAYHFEASNELGNTIQTDASPEVGGSNLAFRPMQLLLAAVGSCSVIDLISILQKQKQQIDDIKVTVNGEREKDAVPALFTDIQLHYQLFGPNLNEDKVRKAIDLALHKYCSVAKTLESRATITYTFTIN